MAPDQCASLLQAASSSKHRLENLTEPCTHGAARAGHWSSATFLLHLKLSLKVSSLILLLHCSQAWKGLCTLHWVSTGMGS